MKIEVKKILSIILSSLAYITATSFVQYRYKNSFDVGEGILYFYSNTLYLTKVSHLFKMPINKGFLKSSNSRMPINKVV